MIKRCAFTIVAKNYIGLGLILGQSLRQHNPEVDFRIFVADELEDNSLQIPDNVLFAKQTGHFTEEEWTDLSFKYDLTEFCTAIKPSCFQYIFELGYHQAIYLDPDIYIFSPIDIVFERLQRYEVVLTPQIAGIHTDYQGEHPEWAMNVNGIFNLGFCGMRQSETTSAILSWWRKRLMDNCFMDRSVGNFTDQKWMDWLPGFLGSEGLYVCHELGMNMAPWNYFERELFLKDGQLMVRYRTHDMPQREDKLVFIHFAGYDYTKMKQGIIERKRIEDLQEYEDLTLATKIYQEAIMQNHQLFDTFIGQTYSYGCYDNGQKITSFHRRLYHGLTEREHHYQQPFATSKGSFYDEINRKGMIVDTNLDRLTQRNMAGIEKKRRMIGLLFKGLYRSMGYKRYVLFVKSLYNYCRPEWHTFLIKRS